MRRISLQRLVSAVPRVARDIQSRDASCVVSGWLASHADRGETARLIELQLGAGRGNATVCSSRSAMPERDIGVGGLSVCLSVTRWYGNASKLITIWIMPFTPSCSTYHSNTPSDGLKRALQR